MNGGVGQVLQRIHAIENRFSANKPRGTANFREFMKLEMNRKENPQSAVGLSKAEDKVFSSGAPDEIQRMIKRSADKYGVDPRLVDAVAQAESNYRPNVVSGAGAVGVMQLMPGTASELGVKNMYDPNENIDGGTKYIKKLLTAFNGDVTKAVAAYNAGPQAVKNYGGVPPYAETQNYVRKVMDIYH